MNILGKLARYVPSSLGKLGKSGKVPSNIARMPPSNIPSGPTGPTGPTGIQTHFLTIRVEADQGEDSFTQGRFILKRHFQLSIQAALRLF